MEIDINKHSEFIFGAIPDGNPEHALTRMGVENFWGNSNSTGVRVRFSTNSQTVGIKLGIGYSEVEAYFGSMMVNGVSYIVKNRQSVLKMECASGRNKDVQILYKQNGNDYLDYEIHCPVKSASPYIYIYIDDNSEIRPSDKLGEPILFLGGPTTFGRGCTFSHGMYSSIVARKFLRDYYNLAIYNGKYLEEQYVAKAAKAVSDPCFVVSEICSIPVPTEYIEEKLEQYLEKLAQSYCACPILLLSQPYYGKKRDNYIACRKIVGEVSKKHPERNIMYLDGGNVLDGISPDMATLSSYLTNDYGNMVLADRIIKIADAFIN